MDRSKRLFYLADPQIRRIFLPLLAEQTMNTLVGLISTMMVGYAGIQALSAVGIVSSLNLVVLNIFSSLASGLAVTVSQLIGADQRSRASDTASQFLAICVATAFVVGIGIMAGAWPLLRFLFGSAEPAVLDMAHTYLTASALSYPFLVVVSVLSGVLRACGNSRTSMWVTLLVNVVNAGISALTIYGFDMGVQGVAIALLTARVFGAALMIVIMLRPSFPVPIRKFYPFSWPSLKPAFLIGVPMALDSTMFNGGKLLVQVFMTGMGTAAMAANAAAGSATAIMEAPGGAVSLLTVTLVGHAVGAGDEVRARSHMNASILNASMLWLVVCIPVWFAAPAICTLFSDIPEVIAQATTLVRILCIAAPPFWSTSFVLPNGLRAAGDTRFSFTVSIISMWLCRVGFSWLFGIRFGWGVPGIWLAMVADWVFRSVPFVLRMLSGGWKNRAVVRREAPVCASEPAASE